MWRGAKVSRAVNYNFILIRLIKKVHSLCARGAHFVLIMVKQ